MSTQSWVPSVPGKIPGGMTSCPTPVGPQAGVVLFDILRLYQVSSTFCLYQVKSTFCLYQVKSTFCLYQIKSTFCLYQVKSTFCLYQGVVYPYLHQRPWGSERLGGRYTPVERLRRRLRHCRREGHLLGDDTCCGRLVSPISNTVGGWAQRSKAAASGRAASITTCVSGRWASGSSG